MLRHKSIVFLFVFALATAWLVSEADAGFIDFEEGTDGQPIASTIPGVDFSATGGQNWIYGDWRTGNYEGPYPDGAYYSNGNFFAWLGTGQGWGNIVFTQAHATYFTVGFSAAYNLVLEAYGPSMNLVDTQTGTPNLQTGQMDFITVNGDDIATVRVKEETEFGNYWIIDDVETDAITACTLDEHCDDGEFCNGAERCIDFECLPADSLPCGDDGLFCNGEEYCNTDTQQCDARNAPDCSDDGLFCNGEESCDEEQDTCIHSGNPCLDDKVCDEETDECLDQEEDKDEDEEQLWPKGQISGGCCGC